jgi:GDP-D-mannose dehydratase
VFPIHLKGAHPKTRIYQASTSELYGLVQEIPQRSHSGAQKTAAWYCRHKAR